jgi:hypothetical protein
MPTKETLRVIVGTAQHQFMAEINLPEVDWPDSIEGRLLGASVVDLLSLNFGGQFGGEPVTATIRGKRYKFERVEKDGTFKLQKDF